MIMKKGLKNLNREDYKPLYVQLADSIKAYIKENSLKPGDPVPSQNDLIGHYGVSQITIRQAMARLTTEGVVTRIQGKGTFVAETKIKESIEGIQSLEDRLAEQGLTVTNVYVESQVVYPAKRIMQELGFAEGDQTLKIRRLKLVDGNLLGLESRHLPLQVANRFSQDELETVPFVNLLARARDTRVERISYYTRAATIYELEAEIMKVPADTSVLVQHGVFYNKSDRPVMAGRITYLAEKMEIQYEIKRLNDHRFKVIA